MAIGTKVADRGTYQSAGVAVSSCPIPVTGTISVGNTMVIRVLMNATGRTVTGVSDTQSNPGWTLGRVRSGTYFTLAVYYCVVTTQLTTADTVTLSWSGGTTVTAGILEEWSDAMALDQGADGPAGTTTAVDCGTTGVTSDAVEVVYGCYAVTGSHNITPGSGYSALSLIASTVSNIRSTGGVYKVTSSTGTQNPTGTLVGGSGNHDSLTVTFKAASTPPTSGTGAAAMAIAGAASGTIKVAGTGAAALALAAAGSGVTHVAGTGAAALTIAGAASGTVYTPTVGTGAAALAIAAAASGTIKVAGTGAASLSIAGAAAGTILVPVSGTGAATLTLSGAATGTIVTPTPPPYPVPYVAAAGYAPLTLVWTDLRSGAVLGTLPLQGAQFGKTLNGTGSFTGTINLADPYMQQADPLGLTIPGRSGVYVSYNGGIVWDGVTLGTRNWDFESKLLTIAAASSWAWFKQRVQATDYSSPPYSGFTGPSTPMPIWDAAGTSSQGIYDPLLIAWQILSDALGVTFGNIIGGLGIAANGFTDTTSYLASGSNTPQSSYIGAITYPYTSTSTIDTMVSQLAQLSYGVGFDFAIDCQFSAGPLSVPVGTLNLSYPQRGLSAADSNLYVDMRSAVKYSFPEAGDETGNIVYEQGQNGALTIVENILPIEGGYPLLEKVISRSNLNSANIATLLEQLGMSDSALYSYPPVVPQVTLDLFDGPIQLGQFIEGDEATLVIPGIVQDGSGQVFDPRFPNGMNQAWRIASWNATVADQGQATLDLTFNAPLTAVGPPLS